MTADAFTGIRPAEGAQGNLGASQGDPGAEHPNARRLRQAHEAFQVGDVEQMFSLMADDIVWYLPGHNALSGEYRGREGVLKNFAMLQARVDTYWAQGLDYFGSDNHAALVARVKATRGDRTLECEECLLFRVEHGRFTRVWHMALDDHAWDAFFAT